MIGYTLMMFLALILSAVCFAATPFAGLEWRPAPGSDPGFPPESEEFQQIIRPGLTAFAGVAATDRLRFSGALGVARSQNSTWMDGGSEQLHLGVVRPSLDARLSLSSPAEDELLPWLMLGLHANLPSARNISSTHNDEEQELADQIATEKRSQLTGYGGRLGLGCEWPISPTLGIGASYAIEAHFSPSKTEEERALSTWTGSYASLLLFLSWGTPKER